MTSNSMTHSDVRVDARAADYTAHGIPLNAVTLADLRRAAAGVGVASAI